MGRITTVSVIAGLMMLAAPMGVALACKGPTVLLEDDFTVLDPAWGNAGEFMLARDGKLAFIPEENKYQTAQNQANIYTDADICVKFQTVKTDDPTNAWGSIVFWAVDYDSYYVLNIASNGFFQVARWTASRWLTPVAWTETPAIKQGFNVWNDLRLTLRGREATVIINGTEVVKFKGQPPADGFLLGLGAASSTATRGEFEFDDLKITD